MSPPSQQDVMAALKSRGPRSMHLVELCQALGVPPHERDIVLDVLEPLVSLRFVTPLPGNRFRIVKEKARKKERPPRTEPSENEGQRLTGRLTRHPRGFGFVAVGDGESDVFIPKTGLRGALHGDRVEVRAHPSPKGRDGEVLKVLERATPFVTGVIEREGRQVWFSPDNPRLPPRMYVRGKIPREAKRGDTAVARYVHYPRDHHDEAVVEIFDILGAPGDTAVEVAKIKLREGIVEVFPPDVCEEAEAMPNSVPEDEIQRREDIRDLDIVTIDPADARDHDDAIFIERRPDGGYFVVIAIADVSHYVTPGSRLDEEALNRACSIYLPDRAIPMLPPELSSGLASLVPDEDRLAMAVEVELDASANLIRHRFFEAVIRSKARLTYPGVARALGLTSEPEPEPTAEARLPMLQTLRALSGTLRKRRQRRGSLDFDLPEARILLDEESVEPLDAYRAKRDPGIDEAYTLVEEMMLLANELVARQMVEAKLPAIFRVHAKPLEDRLALFSELAGALGHDLSVEQASQPKALAAFLQQMKGDESAPVLSYLLLRSMPQAIYDTKNIGHFGLALKDYVHFTSPIRRYPDLRVHRTLRAFLRGERFDIESLRQELQEAATESSWLERRAMMVERDVVNLYRTILMRDRIGEEFQSRISGFSEDGIFVTFDEPFVDGFIAYERLSDDFEPDRLGLRVQGVSTGIQYALGDALTVRLDEVSIDKRRLFVFPAGHAPGPTRGPRRPPQRRKKSPSKGARGGPNQSKHRGAKPKASGKNKSFRKGKKAKGRRH